jgi:hypothetical protein
MGANPNTTGKYYWPPPESNPFTGMSEGARDREMIRLAMSYIAAHPLRYIGYAWPKLRALIGNDYLGWMWATARTGHPLPPIMGSLEVWRLMPALFVKYYHVMLFLAAAGALLALWSLRSTRAAVLPLLVLCYWAALHMALIGDDRFHFGVTPLLALLAGLAIAAPLPGLQRLRQRAALSAARRDSPRTGRRPPPGPRPRRYGKRRHRFATTCLRP